MWRQFRFYAPLSLRRGCMGRASKGNPSAAEVTQACGARMLPSSAPRFDRVIGFIEDKERCHE